MLSGYGNRVQESAFEAILPKAKLAKLLRYVSGFADDTDNIRIYRLKGSGEVTFFGPGTLPDLDDWVFI